LRRVQRLSSSQSGAKRDAGERGFSIIEVCIALLILLIASIGVATAFVFSIHNNSSAGDRAMALAVAQQRLEQLRNKDFNNGALAATVNPVVETINSAGRPFRITTTITDVDTDTNPAAAALDPTAKLIRIDVTPQGNSTSESWANGTVTLIVTRTAFNPGPNFCGTC
jgi:Tfp pilus assembly protein PilV